MLIVHVHSQIKFFGVAFTTNGTLMDFSFIIFVQFQVFCKVPILSKFFATELAVERLFSSMDSHVVKQVPGLFENFITVVMLTS